MLNYFIKETEYKFDLGNIYEYFLLNKDQMEPSLAVEAFHRMMSFKKTLNPKPYIPFYPKNWAFVKKTLDEYQANNVRSKPNEYYFIPATFDESKLEQEEKDQIHASTAISSGEGGQEYDWERWKPYQYDIYSLIEEFIIEWQDTEDHKYWLSWYLTLLDESSFNTKLHTFLCSLTGLNKDDLYNLLKDLRIKNLSIFQLSQWDKKLRFLTKVDLEPNLINTEDSESEMNTAGRPQNEVVIGKLITRNEHGEVTDLSLDETLALFSLLYKYKCIVLDKSMVPKSTIGKVIAAITGYSPDTISRKIENYEIKEETYRKIREKIGPLMSFINSELQK